MILFDNEFKVLSRESRSIPRKDGNGTFDFVEVKIETTDKKPTVLIARLADNDADIKVGHSYLMKIGLTSTLTSTGRLFNNFVVSMFKETGVASEEPVADAYDEIPF